VVGLATLHVLSVINRDQDLAQLTALVVDEHVRGQGVGRALVHAVEAAARALGCERLTVTTHVERSGAQAFYPQVGLKETGRRYGKDLLS
jgi:GNAT superfamily N-acetyltransferase